MVARGRAAYAVHAGFSNSSTGPAHSGGGGGGSGAHGPAAAPLQAYAHTHAQAACAPRPGPAADDEDVRALARGVVRAERRALARAITLLESSSPHDAAPATSLLRTLASMRPSAGGSASPAPAHAPAAADSDEASRDSLPGGGAGGHALLRGDEHEPFTIGITGPPGAGKSTLIDAFAMLLLEQGERVGVLAIDPSSPASSGQGSGANPFSLAPGSGSGGAVLGDKARMSALSNHPSAYVRPSPTRGTLGGVCRSTADALEVLGAAGFSVAMVETVGVGQSETAVAGLVDCVVLVLPPVGGDALQMIKRGIMEVADIIVVNKADGSTAAAAKSLAMQHGQAAALMPHRTPRWDTPALACSAVTQANLGALADALARFARHVRKERLLGPARAARRAALLAGDVQEVLMTRLAASATARATHAALLPRVLAGEMPAREAAAACVDDFLRAAGK